MSESILEVCDVVKTYHLQGHDLEVLKGVSFTIQEGEIVAVTGSSGSGKSTLLGLCAGLDQSDGGSLSLCGQNLQEMSEDERAILRCQSIGFIFQSFQLLSTLTALENVMVPLELQGRANRESEALAKELLKDVGLEARMDHYPTQLSGGEQQRVAIARAFINRPRVLFADEPTGNLDTETSEMIENQLFAMNEKYKTTLILVTHDRELADRAQRCLQMKGGKLV